jgi:glycosyltransferase involved in cell wall biosynthesis
MPHPEEAPLIRAFMDGAKREIDVAGMPQMWYELPMPHVTIDLERLKTPHCGLGQYSLHLGRALAQQAGGELQLRLFLPPQQAALFAGLSVEFDYVRSWRREALVRPLRPLLAVLSRQHVDLWHTTHQQAKYLPLDARTRVLLTIHDLNFLREGRPAKVARELRSVQRLVDRAVAVTTISQFVASEVCEHLNLRGKPLHVIYNGAFAGPRHAAVRPHWLPQGPFLFTIGDITPKKNFHVLVDFVACVADYRLVIAGRKGHSYAGEIETLVRRRGLSDRVLLPGPISDAERAWLYEHCEALVFPSKTEGFGLPVIEAMSLGRPVFVSHATSLPEVAGPLGFYWHEYSPEHMANVFHAGLQTFASDPDYSRKLQAYASRFTWERSAAGYLQVYRDLLGLNVQKLAA